jgi:hypothetical protein
MIDTGFCESIGGMAATGTKLDADFCHRHFVFLGCSRRLSKLPVTPWKPFMACFQSHFMTRAALQH